MSHNNYAYAIILIVAVLLVSCSRGEVSESESDIYYCFIENTSNVYYQKSCDHFYIACSDISAFITSQKLCGYTLACVKLGDGKYYAAIADADAINQYLCFYEISDDAYYYYNTITYSEYLDVMGKDGFILTYDDGSDNRNILYFYIKDGEPALLAECYKVGI